MLRAFNIHLKSNIYILMKMYLEAGIRYTGNERVLRVRPENIFRTKSGPDKKIQQRESHKTFVF